MQDGDGQYHDLRGRVHNTGRRDGDQLKFLRRLMAGDVSLERAQSEIHQRHFQGRAAASTVEALMPSLRERGTAALKQAPVRRRLDQLSPEQLREVLARLIKLRARYSVINDELLLRLEERLP